MSVTDRLRELGISIPSAPRPVATYVPAVRTGNLVFTSGQLPFRDGELLYRGQVDQEVNVDQAYQAARIAALNCLSAFTTTGLDLDEIVQIVRVTVYVNSGDGFTQQPAVANGASDLLQEIFDQAGRHARAAVGVHGLPLGASVEVDMIAEVRD